MTAMVVIGIAVVSGGFLGRALVSLARQRRAIREAARLIPQCRAPYAVAPPEGLVMGESFETFCARECGMTERS